MPPRMFRVPQAPPPLRLRVKGVAPPGQHNMPVMVRNSLGGEPNYPGPNGNPGSGIWPYSESSEWGGTGASAAQGSTIPSSFQPPSVGSGVPGLDATQVQSQSIPYGESARDWNNPTSYATVPLLGNIAITAGQSQNLPVLSLNFKRNSLIIQNQSNATVAGDIAPTLYIGFNVQAVAFQSLALPPGLGFFWGASDCPPRDSIYVAFGALVNTGGSVVIAGCIVQGTYMPNGQPYIPPQGGQTMAGDIANLR
jgi:hypothetical protein